jgi:hypothetical protein
MPSSVWLPVDLGSCVTTDPRVVRHGAVPVSWRIATRSSVVANVHAPRASSTSSSTGARASHCQSLVQRRLDLNAHHNLLEASIGVKVERRCRFMASIYGSWQHGLIAQLKAIWERGPPSWAGSALPITTDRQTVPGHRVCVPLCKRARSARHRHRTRWGPACRVNRAHQPTRATGNTMSNLASR